MLIFVDVILFILTLYVKKNIINRKKREREKMKITMQVKQDIPELIQEIRKELSPRGNELLNELLEELIKKLDYTINSLSLGKSGKTSF